MAIDKHIRRGHPIIFGLMVFFAIIELSISAWLVSRFNANHNFVSTTERDRVRYLLFLSCWTVFFSFLYLVLFLHSASTGSTLTSVGSHAIYLFITWLFWTAGAAAITETLGGGLNCSNNKRFVYCGQLNALMAFAWIEWSVVTVAFAFVLVRGIIVARRGDGYRSQLVSTA
jgi:hypothetical protein